MKRCTHFDFIIIGNGLAGLQLALKLSSEKHFEKSSIALIDPSTKSDNDKTWSFWESQSSQWDTLAYKTWDKASIITSKKTIDLTLNPYVYRSIRAIDFYKDAKSELSKKNNIKFILEHVTSVSEVKSEKAKVIVTTGIREYSGSHVFDSRIPETFSLTSKHTISIIQHFKGWVIQTKNDAFEDHTVTMMDYRLKDGNQTTFTYVLPFSKTEALVEFTYFTAHTVTEDVYDAHIKQYIKDYLNIDVYKVIETETGQIPMTNYKFEKFNTKNITKIGTAGGWVKGSTGYSFKHTEKKVNLIINNLKADVIPSQGLFKRKYKFYDKIFLKVLKDENHKGEWIFENFYSKNSVQTMFRFLDEESTFREEIKIMLSLFSWSFIKAFFKTL